MSASSRLFVVMLVVMILAMIAGRTSMVWDGITVGFLVGLLHHHLYVWITKPDREDHP